MKGQSLSPADSTMETPDNHVATSDPATVSGDNTHAPYMSGAETREIVTPYAFKVADELLGQPLASPWRRLFAQLIDLAAVAVLSTANAFILAFLAALTFFKAGNNLAGRPQRTRTRRLLRFIASMLLFFVIFLIATAYHDMNGYHTENSDTGGIVTPFLGGVNIAAWSLCDDDTCKQEVASGFGEAMAENQASAEQVQTVFDLLVQRSKAQENDEAILREYYLGTYNDITNQQISLTQAENASAPEDTATPEPTIGTVPELTPLPGETDLIAPVSLSTSAPSPQSESTFSMINIVDGLIKDLGLGFGWAALYYSVFTAWWRGSTPGKRLMGIRVLKLDGSTLTLWESFERYGGYGAGLATGLLGFLQVFWDPNRQSIQDKIAETLVLRKSDELSRITASGKSLSATHSEKI